MTNLLKHAVYFPLVQVNDGEGRIIMTWRPWQLGLFLYIWWNFS